MPVRIYCFSHGRNFRAGLRLHLHGARSTDELKRSLLRIARIDLQNRKSRRAGRDTAHHDPENRSAAAYSRRVRHACGGDKNLAAFLVHALDKLGWYGLLRSTGEEAALAHIFDRDNLGIVLQQHGDGI